MRERSGLIVLDQKLNGWPAPHLAVTVHAQLNVLGESLVELGVVIFVLSNLCTNKPKS